MCYNASGARQVGKANVPQSNGGRPKEGTKSTLSRRTGMKALMRAGEAKDVCQDASVFISILIAVVIAVVSAYLDEKRVEVYVCLAIPSQTQDFLKHYLIVFNRV